MPVVEVLGVLQDGRGNPDLDGFEPLAGCADAAVAPARRSGRRLLDGGEERLPGVEDLRREYGQATGEDLLDLVAGSANGGGGGD